MMEFTLMLEIGGFAGLALMVAWQWLRISRLEKAKDNLGEALNVLLKRLTAERTAHFQTLKQRDAVENANAPLRASQRDLALRMHEAGKSLEIMTLERDRLLADVIQDMDMELVFKSPADADAYLARRKGQRKIPEAFVPSLDDMMEDTRDIDDDEHDASREELYDAFLEVRKRVIDDGPADEPDDLFDGVAKDEPEELFDGVAEDDPFISATPEETTKARDELLAGFDDEVRHTGEHLDADSPKPRFDD